MIVLMFKRTEIEISCNILNVFTVTYDQLYLLLCQNKSIHLFQNKQMND